MEVNNLIGLKQFQGEERTCVVIYMHVMYKRNTTWYTSKLFVMRYQPLKHYKTVFFPN